MRSEEKIADRWRNLSGGGGGPYALHTRESDSDVSRVDLTIDKSDRRLAKRRWRRVSGAWSVKDHGVRGLRITRRRDVTNSVWQNHGGRMI